MTLHRSNFALSAILAATSLLAGCASEPEYQHAFDHSRQLHRNTHVVETSPERARQVVIATFIRDGFTISESSGDVISATRLLLDPDDSDLSYQVVASAVVSPLGDDKSFIALSANQKTIRHKDSYSVERQQGTIDDEALYQSFFADVDDHLARLPKSAPNPLARTARPAAAAPSPVQTPAATPATARVDAATAAAAQTGAVPSAEGAATRTAPPAERAGNPLGNGAFPASPGPAAAVPAAAAPAAALQASSALPASSLPAAAAAGGSSLLGALVDGGASAVSAGAGLVQSAASVASSAVQAAPAAAQAAQAYQGTNLAVPAAAVSGIAAVLVKSSGLLDAGSAAAGSSGPDPGSAAGAAAQQAKALAERERKKAEDEQREKDAAIATAGGASTAGPATEPGLAAAGAAVPTAETASAVGAETPPTAPVMQDAAAGATSSTASNVSAAATTDDAAPAGTAADTAVASQATPAPDTAAGTAADTAASTTIVVKDSPSLAEKAGESVAGLGLQAGLKTAAARFKDRLPPLLGGTTDKDTNKDKADGAAAAAAPATP